MAVAFNYVAGSVQPNFGSGVDPVGPNTYTVVISDSREEKTRDGEGVMTIFELQIQHGKYKGKTVPFRLNTANKNPDTVKWAYESIEALIQLTGTIPPGQQMTNTGQLHGQPFNVAITCGYLAPRAGSNGPGSITNEIGKLSPFDRNGALLPEADSEVPELETLKARATPSRGFSQAGGGAFNAAGGPPGAAQPTQAWQAPGAAPAQPAQPAATAPAAGQSWQPPAAQQPAAQTAPAQPAATPGAFVPPTQGGPAPGAAQPAAQPQPGPAAGAPQPWTPGAAAPGGAPQWSAPR